WACCAPAMGGAPSPASPARSPAAGQRPGRGPVRCASSDWHDSRRSWSIRFREWEPRHRCPARHLHYRSFGIRPRRFWGGRVLWGGLADDQHVPDLIRAMETTKPAAHEGAAGVAVGRIDGSRVEVIAEEPVRMESRVDDDLMP